jgi:TonB-dependent outer membrane receptor, SusC/RagA subfamily, signature region
MREASNFFKRITFVILLVSISIVAVAQNITVKNENQPLSDILTKITQCSGYKFVYSSAMQNKLNVLSSIDCTNSTIENVLDELFKDKNISYKINGKNIALAPSEIAQFVIQGVVKDNTNNAVPYASVSIKEDNSFVVTDTDGSFSITTNRANGEIIVSCVGYETKTVKYNNKASLKIILVEAVNELDGVSVVAYGTRKTREIVGSISSVKINNVKNMPAASVQNILQGQMAGVEVTNLSGGPGGGGAQITIRGFNSLGGNSGSEGVVDGSPLFVIDGVPVKSSPSVFTGGINTLAGLDVTSIESVEVLKDAASASLYGSRAGNGVILITTKKENRESSIISKNFSICFFFTCYSKTNIGKGRKGFSFNAGNYATNRSCGLDDK